MPSSNYLITNLSAEGRPLLRYSVCNIKSNDTMICGIEIPDSSWSADTAMSKWMLNFNKWFWKIAATDFRPPKGNQICITVLSNSMQLVDTW